MERLLDPKESTSSSAAITNNPAIQQSSSATVADVAPPPDAKDAADHALPPDAVTGQGDDACQTIDPPVPLDRVVKPKAAANRRTAARLTALDFNQISYRRPNARVPRKPRKNGGGDGGVDDGGGDDNGDDTVADSDGSSSLADDCDGQAPTVSLLPGFEEFSGGSMEWCQDPNQSSFLKWLVLQELIDDSQKGD